MKTIERSSRLSVFFSIALLLVSIGLFVDKLDAFSLNLSGQIIQEVGLLIIKFLIIVLIVPSVWRWR